MKISFNHVESSVRRPSKLALVGVLIVTMCACQSTTNLSSSGAIDADQILLNADNANLTPEAIERRIEAAGVFRLEGNDAAILGLLTPINVEQLRRERKISDERVDQLLRLRAQAANALGDPQRAEADLLQLYQRIDTDYGLLADICEALSHYQCAADGLIQYALLMRDRPLEPDADIEDIRLQRQAEHDRIWNLLNRARSAPVAFTHRYHHAWWLLQQRMREATAISDQVQIWRAWSRQYPSHPASIQPPRQIVALQDYTPPNVAVLLPLSGPFAAAGKSVRDGMMAAYLATHRNDNNALRFFDTAAQSLGQLWEQVQTSNADVVVGPLLKNNVERYADLTAFAGQSRLTLNYLSETEPVTPNDNGTPLYQLGIAIEDEASSLARAVVEQGYERVAVVYGADGWADRAMQAFETQWPFVHATASFDDIKDLTSAVGQVMGIGDSEARRRQIADIIGMQVEFLPRARQDLEAIVAFTSNVETRALEPALEFHFGGDLPVYTTSQALRGRSHSGLDGYFLTEMPLMLETGERSSSLRRAFNIENNSRAELYALGYDAVRLAGWLPTLKAGDQFTLPGASGFIWLGSAGRFNRELDLARYTDQGLIPVTQDQTASTED